MKADDAVIRTTVAGDTPDLGLLYRTAFPDEDLLPLVRRLLREEPGILSLAAAIDHLLVGHIMFTPCGVGGHDCRVALLAPLAVAPAWQGQGIGGTLVRNGLDQLRQRDVERVVVLGDPQYYGRFGFLPEHFIRPPYTLPSEWSAAWQSIGLQTSAKAIEGVLTPPPAWLSAALWAP